MKWIGLLFVMLILSGCVERSLQIDSEPRGALVLLDEVKAGVTPLTIPFSHYGVREIRLEKRGFQKMTAIREVEQPWYQDHVISFFFDVLWPFKIEDKHRFSFKLNPVRYKIR